MADTSQPAPLRVGYAVSKKKQTKFITHFAKFLQEQQVEAVALDFSSLPTQDVDVLLHKLVDEMALRHTDQGAALMIRHLLEYTAVRPQLPLVDPWAPVQDVMDRAVVHQRLQEGRVSCPPSASWDADSDWTSIATSDGLRFPVLCKSRLSCGLPSTHEISVVHTLDQLKAIPVDHPLFLQNYIHHDGHVHKVYVIDDDAWLAKRRSISLGPNKEVASFNSQNFCQPEAEAPKASLLGCGLVCEVDENQLMCMVKGVRAATGLSLFGIDIIIEEGTGMMFCVDLNYFPGYKEVSDVNVRLLAHLRRVVDKARTSAP